jgi:hypothetical protein
MALKVTARRKIDSALNIAATLQDDSVARVRQAAEVAIGCPGTEGARPWPPVDYAVWTISMKEDGAQ